MENAMKNEYVKQIEEFRFYCLWGVWPGKRKYKEMKFVLSVKSEEDVLLAVNKAYYDMTPRTIKNFAINIEDKNAKVKIENYKREKLGNIKKKLAERIKETFEKKEFSIEAHKKICDEFLISFNELISEINRELYEINETSAAVENICFGKAQKIVNMTYKYLLLFDDALDDGNEDVFKSCHMAIDSFILTHYKKIEINKEEKKKISNKAWSNMDKDNYYDLQKNIGNYVNDKPLIFAEFDWWRDEQIKKSEKEPLLDRDIQD